MRKRLNTERKSKDFCEQTIIHTLPIQCFPWHSPEPETPFVHFIRRLPQEGAHLRTLPLGQRLHLGIVGIQPPLC